MALKPGTRLGQYEIRGLIGAGGMGEVYQGHDTKLERDVAIKVLPEAFARDPERVARFKREAKVLASLNHNNIAAIYGLEESGPTHFLVMEYVPGETLADQVRRGAVEMPEALHIASQISDALEHAHEKTVMHRDLKPANVKVTPDGTVKVLDFGLAKAFAAAPELSDPSNSPTLSAMPTLPGVILGTAAYMSPEQARGKTVDKRTDIWALGCVLYELLTGNQTFRGEDVTEILASVVKAEPEWTALPAETPHGIRVLLRRSLEKDSKKRYRDAADVRIQIEETLAAPSPVQLPAVAPPALPLWRRAAPWAVGLVLSVVVGIAVWGLKPSPATQGMTRFALMQPPEERLVVPSASLALSPDGTQLAYVSLSGGQQKLYLRPLDSLEPKAIAGTEGANNPFFSPDGQWVGIFAGGKMKKVSVSGGAALALCDASGTPNGASWGPNDTIVYGTGGASSSLYQVSASGGTPQLLSRADASKGEVSYRWPEFLPNGKAVLYTAGTSSGNYDDAQIMVLKLDTGERRVLVQGGTSPHYLPTGHLIYARAGTIMARPFDLNRLEATGEAVPLLEGVITNPSNGTAQMAASANGTLVYAPGSAAALAQSRLVWVDRRGNVSPVLDTLHAYETPRLSPDGERIAVTVRESFTDIWVYQVGRGTLTRLSFEPTENETPAWTPDGKRVAYSSARPGGPRVLFWKAADGSTPEEKLFTEETLTDHHHIGSWSPDGRTLALTNYAGLGDLWMLPLEGQKKLQPFLKTDFNERTPQFSPDGHLIAYTSNESGRDEVYVRAYPGPGGKWQISTDGGAEPVWARNGRELFYRNGDKMMAVAIVAQPFASGQPKLLFEGVYGRSINNREANYDASPDGQRFLMVKASEQRSAATQINVVLNWFEELRRVPAAR